MDPIEMKAFMDMHGYPFGFGLFGFHRYPPSAGILQGMASHPAKLKEKILKENPLFSARLNDFGRMYLRHASSLFDMNSSVFPPGHPMYDNRVDITVAEENEKLKRENLELRKRLEQITKGKNHI
ncbi:MAG: hypothetical protein QXE84_07220 [Candidatus Nitrosotenuis sp.]|uniref:Uncharacterized protein n=1 Tax=Candidatus Nitrosotenuis uzonensis TaxID=1407055 RepID=A0A812F342_9ARCH|nr:hypothetical protein [Candidatus Nitrosotenuis uzonensis]CAE6499377.1 conserved hypothetical protein [Candidatus Nitrosotenuis uzonensis]